MVPRRVSGDERDNRLGVLQQDSRGRLAFRNVVRIVMRDHRLLNQILSRTETVVRAAVRDEVGRLLQPLFEHLQRCMANNIGPSVSRPSLQLRFIGDLPDCVFSSNKLAAKDGTLVQVELVDGTTDMRVLSGPLSLIKIKIVVLNGDFSQEEWSQQEFKDSICRERNGRRPLAVGELDVVLTQGVGVLSNVVITDNSSWLRSKKFRLGATTAEYEGTIQGARSQPFRVKDIRGERYIKHYPPYPGDEVWRLENIAKDGVIHTRLAGSSINTVKDLLRVYATKPTELWNIISDGEGNPNRTMDAIIAHAMTCILDSNECYIFFGDNVSLVFNSIYMLVGALFDAHNYLSVDQLTAAQKFMLEELKVQVYKNVRDLTPFNFGATLNPSSTFVDQSGDQNPESLEIEPLASSSLQVQIPAGDFPVSRHNSSSIRLSDEYGFEDYQDMWLQDLDLIDLASVSHSHAKWCKVRAAVKVCLLLAVQRTGRPLPVNY